MYLSVRWTYWPRLLLFSEQTYPDKVDSENTLDAFLGKSKKGRKELVIEGMFNYAYRQGDWALIPPYYNPYSKETVTSSVWVTVISCII